MADQINPYESPTVPITAEAQDGEVPAKIIELIQKTRPWVLASVIIFSIIAFFSAVWTIIILLGGIFGGIFATISGIQTYQQLGGSPNFLFLTFSFLSNLGGAIAYVMMAIFLTKFFNRAKILDKEQTEQRLVETLSYMRKHWKTVGFLIILSIVSTIVMVPLSIFANFG